MTEYFIILMLLLNNYYFVFASFGGFSYFTLSRFSLYFIASIFSFHSKRTDGSTVSTGTRCS